MIRSLAVISSVVVVSAGALSGAIIKHTFTGKTYLNPVVELNDEFPVGTAWEVRVEWDDTEVGEVYMENQAGYPLTKFTMTLKGKSGDWTSSSLPGKARMLLNRFGSHELSFSGGYAPESYTNGAIPGGATYYIGVILSDPTNTALPDITKIPGPVDTKIWSATDSHLKFYISNDAKAIFGNVDGLGATSEPPAPEITVQQPKGKELVGGKSTVRYASVKKGKDGETKTFVIQNTGKKTLKGLKLNVGGKHKDDFLDSGLSKKSLAPGAKMTFKVSFSPKAVGKRKAVVSIESNDADESPFTMVLTGAGL
jgi:hypothetical protein